MFLMRKIWCEDSRYSPTSQFSCYDICFISPCALHGDDWIRETWQRGTR